MGWQFINGRPVITARSGWTPPKSLTAALITGGVQLDWTNGEVINRKQVYFSVDNGVTFLPIVTGLLASTVTFNHYWDGGYSTQYKVRAFNGTSYSAWSNIVTIVVPDVDAQMIIARMTALLEEPSAAQKTNIATTILALKAAGLYNEHDAFVLTRQNGLASSKLNQINQYDTITWSSKLTGSADETGHPGVVRDGVFYQVRELSNGDLLSGAGTYGGHYYRSVNKGENWTDEGQINVDAEAVYDFCDLGNGIVLAGVQGWTGQGHIMRSINYGATWTDLGRITLHDYIPLIVNLGGGIVVASTEKSPTPAQAHVVRSTDYGLTWADVSGNFDLNVINMLCNIGGGIVIAGGGKDNGGGIFADGKIIRSIDYGATWTDLGIIVAGQVRYFGSVSLGNGIVLAGSSNGCRIVRSIDSGATWTNLGDFSYGSTSSILSGFVNLGEGKVLAITGVGSYAGRIWRSDDWGESWENVVLVENGDGVASISQISDGSILVSTSTSGTTAAKLFKMSSVYAFTRKTANSYNATKGGAGTLTFTANVGYQNDGATTYIDSNFIPSTASKLKLLDGCFWFKISGTLKGTGYVIQGAVNAGGILFAMYGGAYNVTYWNTSTQSGSQKYVVGYNAISCNNAAGWKEFINALSYDITGVPNILVNKKMALLALNENDVIGYFEANTAVLEGYGFSKYMTQSQFLTLQGIIDAYIAAL